MEQSNKWRPKTNRGKVVDVMTYDGELRIGEIKHRVVVYESKGRFYVRRYEEFIAKFERVPL